jgi:hypothetical protein
MPQGEIEQPPSKGHGEVMRSSRRFSGVLLWKLLEHSGLHLDPSINEHVLRKVVVARDGDGYGAVIAMGEIEPRFQNGQFMVALDDDEGPLSDHDGGLRLIPPFDIAGGRQLKGLASVEFRDA